MLIIPSNIEMPRRGSVAFIPFGITMNERNKIKILLRYRGRCDIIEWKSVFKGCSYEALL